ncbi:MAG: PAS domain S-box protein [Bacteroidales bacterium]|nr:PAS domain S-box protein [Bacteroidales bacterium]
MKKQNPREIQKLIKEVLSNKGINPDELKNKPIEEILEEINIYQQELEFQNVELARIREELEVSEQHYKELFEQAPVAYVIFDCEMKILNANNTFIDLVNGKKNAVLKEKITRFVHPDFQNNFYLKIKSVLNNSEPVKFEFLLVGKASEVFVQVKAVKTFLNDDVQIRMALTDISERVQAEKNLEESEKKFSKYISSTPYGVFRANEKGEYTEVNPSSCIMSGYSESELLKKKIPDLLHKDFVEKGIEHFVKVVKHGFATDRFAFVRKDGEKRWWNITAFKITDSSFLGFCHDVTDEITQEIKFRNVFEVANVGKSITKLDGTIYVNSAFCNMLGFTKEELQNKKWQELTPKDEIPVINRYLKELINGKTPTIRFKKTYFHKNKTRVYADVSVALHRNENGEPEFFITSIVDITAQKISQDILAENEKYQRAIINSSPYAILGLDKKGNVVSWNKAAENIFGWTKEQVINKFIPLVPEENIKEFQAIKKRVLLGETVTGIEVIRKRKDGNLVNISLSAAPIYNSKGVADKILAIIEDTTEKHKNIELLKISESKYRTMFENMVAASCYDQIVYENGKPVDYRIIDVNPSFSRIMGIPKEKLVGRLASEAYGLGYPPFFDVYSEVAETGKPASFEAFFQPAKKFLHVTAASPQPGYFSTVFEDITERKQQEKDLQDKNAELEETIQKLEESNKQILLHKEEYEALNEELRQTNDELSKTNQTTIESNNRIKELLNKTSKHFLIQEKLFEGAKNILELDDFEETARNLFDSCKKITGATSGYVALLAANGLENEVLFLDSGKFNCTVDTSLPMPIRGLRSKAYSSLMPIYHNDFMNSEWIKLMPKGHSVLNNVMFAPLIIKQKAVGLLGLANKPGGFNDEDKETVAAFAELASIALHNSRTKNELVNSKLKAEESDRLKSAFLANMSHEIRTPMNGIMGFIELLENPNISKEKHERFILMVKKSSERLLYTINDIIEISKIESGQIPMNIAKVDVNETLLYFKSFFAKEAENKGLELIIKQTTTKNFFINTDKAKLESILTNLIKNALKFTESGYIEFGAKPSKNCTEFFVKDTGKGIPKEKQEEIFDRFIQADMGYNSPYEGSGLGLSICKAYVEMLGGDITVVSEENKGTTFYFSVKKTI